MKRKIDFIFNYILILGLILLLFNDHVLKEVYGNWWTGKLSDFAGVLILPFCIKFISGFRNHTSILLTILLFTFWKSPMSQGFLDFVNLNEVIYFGRVVDITDLIAFIMLPFAYWGLNNMEKIRMDFDPQPIKRIAQTAIAVLTIGAFIATSVDEKPVSSLDMSSACRSRPVVDSIGNGNIFIPTLFTPDGNGMNDYFQISADTNIVSIDIFRITNVDSREIIYEKFDIVNIIPESGFDGRFNGAIIPMNFWYEFQIRSENDSIGIYSGFVASIPCIDTFNITTPPFYDGCAFTDQHNFVDGYDSQLPPNEIQDCLE